MKQDLRRKVKLVVWIVPHDLDLLEDFLDCIPLCNKHKFNSGEEERELMTMYYECKECEKVRDRWRGAVMRIASQLFIGYYKRFG